MEFFRRTIAQIQSQLAHLGTAGRIAITLCLVIIAISIAWMINFASDREMVPLLNQSFNEVDRARIANKIEDFGNIDYDIRGERIFVPKAMHRKLIFKLSLAEVLPEDTSVGFSTMLEGSDFLAPEGDREIKHQIILQSVLADIISHYPNVAKAEVIITPGRRRKLMGVQPVATASVDVRGNPGTHISRKEASAMAALVSGAVHNLKRHDVQVIVDGKIIAVAPKGEEIPTDYLELKVQTEQYLRDKILVALEGLNARVQVDATPNITSRKISKQKYDEEDSWNAKKRVSGREEESSSSRQQAEPGVIANTSDSSSGASGTVQQETINDNEADFTAFPGVTNTTEVTPPGGYSDLTVAVSIPLAYFEELAKLESGSGDKPSKVAVDIVTKRETPKLKELVMRSVGLKDANDEDRVSINTYWAGALVAQGGAFGVLGGQGGQAAEESAGIGQFAGSHFKEIAVSVLAVISLFMVLMMVRKASGPIEMTEEEAVSMMMSGQPPVDALGVEDSNIVDGEGGGAVLSGMELDDGIVQSHQMLEQVKEMIRDDPAIAANLVNKWATQD